MRNLARRAIKLERLARNAEYRRGLFKGVAAAIEHEGFMRSINIATLLDVGANIGQFSLLALAQHPKLTVHAFEPLSEAADQFERLFRGNPNVVLHRIAAGEITGEAQIHVSARPDSSSLLPISKTQNQIFPGTAEASVRTIHVARLDDIVTASELAGPTLVKLDVQGFELAALRGMPKIMARAQHIYCEVSFLSLYDGQPIAHEVVSWLAERGFHFSGVYNPTTSATGETVQADILFSRSTATS